MPSGQLLFTQFWDTDPATGPTDSWTIHGLWPDNCDGSYPKHCDSSRSHNNIREILDNGVAKSNGSSVLEVMNKYWKDYQGDDDHFWAHEWNKHGTCVSTLKPSCYEDYTKGEDVVDYFTRAVSLFEKLPTYEWLAEANITPDDDGLYSYEAIKSTLAKRHGEEVTVRCRGNVIDEVWYHFNVKGSLQDGEFVAAEPDGVKGKCPAQVHYKAKRAGRLSVQADA